MTGVQTCALPISENYTENEAVKALIKKQMESFGKANNTFVKYFPSSTPVSYTHLETYVTEEIYEILRINLSGLMGDKDDYCLLYTSRCV